jgi:hypothetical protein
VATDRLDVVVAAAAGGDWKAGNPYGKLVLVASVTRAADGTPVLGLKRSSFRAYIGAGLAFESGISGTQLDQNLLPAEVAAVAELSEGFYTLRVGPGSGFRWSNPGTRIVGLLVRDATHQAEMRGQTMTTFELPPLPA